MSRLWPIVCLLLVAAPVHAAPRRSAPPPAAEPPPTPREYWEAPEVFLTEVQDPFGRRRAGRADVAPQTPGAPEPSYYRLWGLQPLQRQFLRRGELVLEVWARPQGGERQAIVRISVRDDDRAFVQGRAGIGCCTPAIGKRVDVDAELPPDAAGRFRALAKSEVWAQPFEVELEEAGATVDEVCVNGVAYEVYLLERGRFQRLRRDCSGPKAGSIADILGPAIGAALGRDPRFDYLFRNGGNYSADKAEYEALLARGGRLKPAVRRN